MNIILVIFTLLLITFFSIGYSYLSKELNITGRVVLQAEKTIRFTKLTNSQYSNMGYDIYNPVVNANDLKFVVNLSELNSAISYDITLKNGLNKTMKLKEVEEQICSNENIKYELSGLNVNDVFLSNTELTFTLTISYKDSVISLPSNTRQDLMLNFIFEEYSSETYAYISNGLTLSLNGTDAPQNNVWIDTVSNKSMTLQSTSYDTENKIYNFSSSAYGSLNEPIIPSTGDFTLETLIKLSSTFSTSIDSAIISQVSDTANDNGRNKINFRYKSNNYVLQYFVNNTQKSSNEEFVFTSSVGTEKNYLLQLVRSGDKLLLYLNGGLVSVSDFSIDSAISQGPFKLGKWNTKSSQPFLGGIYTVRVYNRALTSKELYNNKKIDYMYYLGINPEYSIRGYAIENLTNASGEGLYLSDEDYIFKGSTISNYLRFGEDSDLYRIVGFYNDGTMKLINSTTKINLPFDESRNRTVALSPYCTNSETIPDGETDVFYGCNAWNASNSYTGLNNGTDLVYNDSSSLNYLNTTYYNSLPNVVKNKIVNHDYYVGPVSQTASISSSRTEAKKLTWNGKIGLIGVDDILNAGYNTCAKLTTSNVNCVNYITSISNSTSAMWTINAANVNSWDVWASAGATIGKRRSSRYVQPSGSNNIIYYLYPSFYVLSNYSFTGTGTIDDPFVIE